MNDGAQARECEQKDRQSHEFRIVQFLSKEKSYVRKHQESGKQNCRDVTVLSHVHFAKCDVLGHTTVRRKTYEKLTDKHQEGIGFVHSHNSETDCETGANERSANEKPALFLEN
jgi:hypothetical protein